MPPLHDYYRILGVSDDATQETIKTAFRKLALKYHPDKNPDAAAIEIFTSLHKAYEVLSNPERKQAYDLSRPGKPGKHLDETIARSVVDRTNIRIAVNKRVLRLDEMLQVRVSIFRQNTKPSLSGLHHFELIQEPVTNSLFPPGNNTPEIEITYLLKPKNHGYIEVGPASFVAGNIKYLSESLYVKVNPTPDLIVRRKLSKIEIFQGITYSVLVTFYTLLVGFNIYQYKIYPYYIHEPPALYVSSSRPAMLAYAQLPTGASPFNHFFGPGRYDNASPSKIVFHNDKHRDAVVMLMDANTNQPVRNNYIRAADDLEMGNIPDGEYYLKALFGNDWNEALSFSQDSAIRGGFNKNAGYEIFQHEIKIAKPQQSKSGDAPGYKTYEITLYPVADGNTESLSADAKKFFKD